MEAVKQAPINELLEKSTKVDDMLKPVYQSIVENI